jgi:NitT/TauT family transport system ATP-binding protein
LTDRAAPIVLAHVSKSFTKPPVYVVEDFSLSIMEGEFFCLIGPSGCGKSTVIKLMAGIESPSSGTVTRPKRVGMVFQSYALLPWLTGEGNVSFAARMQGFDRDKVAEVTERYLGMVHLEAFAHQYPREMSGGQRQRVGIARALAVEPDVLLMDEPFSALDPVMTDELHDDVLRIWEQTKKTIVMVSHNFEEAILLADRIGIIKEGKLAAVVEVTLPRPRRIDDATFTAEVRKLRAFLEGGHVTARPAVTDAPTIRRADDALAGKA